MNFDEVIKITDEVVFSSTGKHLSDVQRAVWLLSKPISSNYSLEMENCTGGQYVTSDQHKTASAARITRDREDILKVKDVLSKISPFKTTSLVTTNKLSVIPSLLEAFTVNLRALKLLPEWS